MKIKQNNGSIAVYVIVSFIFLTVVLISMLAASKNSVITSLKAQSAIKNIYENDVKSAGDIYSKEIASSESEIQSQNQSSAESENSSGNQSSNQNQTWVQNGIYVSDGNNIEFEVGDSISGYSVSVDGKTYSNWYVLGAQNGKLLISTKVDSRVTLGDSSNLETSRNDFTTNGIVKLNTEAAKYTNNTYAEGNARTIDLDDINRVTGYVDSVAQYNNGSTTSPSQWGNQVKYTQGQTYVSYVSMNNKYPTSSTDSTETVFSYWTGSTWKTLANGENATLTCNYYKYYPQTNTSTAGTGTEINGSSSAYELLFGGTTTDSTTFYRVGTKYINTYAGSVRYGFFAVRAGFVGGYDLCYSNGNKYSSNFYIRPVVTLKSTVKVSSEGALSL